MDRTRAQAANLGQQAATASGTVRGEVSPRNGRICCLIQYGTTLRSLIQGDAPNAT